MNELQTPAAASLHSQADWAPPGSGGMKEYLATQGISNLGQLCVAMNVSSRGKSAISNAGFVLAKASHLKRFISAFEEVLNSLNAYNLFSSIWFMWYQELYFKGDNMCRRVQTRFGVDIATADNVIDYLTPLFPRIRPLVAPKKIDHSVRFAPSTY